MSKRVFIALSGGVDSSAAALLLKEEGYTVEGIHLELTGIPETPADSGHRRLKNTCRMLNIPLHFLDAQREFKEQVIEYFCAEYSLGLTPNPCVRCNRDIKFGVLLERVQEMGGDYLATGHYARVEPSTVGYRLLKGIDKAKDQSYFLYVLGQKELAHVLFPVGGFHKSEVKKLAAEAGLPASERRESQDICFIPGGDHRTFLSGRLSSRPGDIVDTGGNIRGKHRGLAYYTIGQRQGTGVGGGERLYVIELDTADNRLIIGSREQLYRKSLIAVDLNWISGHAPEGRLEITARVRHRADEAPAALEVKDESAEVIFVEPQKAIAPGQSVVFYQGEAVLGGGIIAGTMD